MTTHPNWGRRRGIEPWAAQRTPPLESNIYAPLSDGLGRPIRLIRILPNDNEAEPVSCHLFAVDAALPVEYAALSYVWGDPNKTTGIVVNGQKLEVTVNLASALWYFRRYGVVPRGSNNRALPLWVDALCINQHDTAERSRQVALMGATYRGASSVLSWLGPPGHDEIYLAFRVIKDIFPHIWAYHFSDDAQRPLRDISETPVDDVLGGLQWLSGQRHLNLPEEDVPLHNTYWTAIFSLGTSNYWSRTWILQELALARPESHYFVCGSQVATFQQFWCFMRFLDSVRCAPLSRPEGLDAGLWALMRTRLFTYTDLESAAKLRAQPGRASYVYHAALVASSSEPRDMVFGLLNVVSLRMRPDYARTVTEVYLDWFREVLEVEDTRPAMEMLKSSGIGLASYQETQGWPSWLPDLSRLGGDHAAIGGTFEDIVRVAVSGAPKPSITPSGVLTVHGANLMAVGYVLQPTELNDTTKLAQFCARFLEWTNAAGGLTCSCHPLLALFQVIFHGRDLATGLLLKECGYRSSPMAQAFYNLLTSQLIDSMDRLGGLLGTTRRAELDGLLQTLFERRGEAEDPADGGSPPRDEESYFGEMLEEFAGQTLILAGQGQLGIAPPETKGGDVVCILDGCSLPVALRRDGSHWVHVGTCWVLGLMDGEHEEMLKSGEAAVEEFAIR